MQKLSLDNQVKNLSLEKFEAYQILKNEQSTKNREKYNKLGNRFNNLTKQAKLEFYKQNIEKKQIKTKVFFNKRQNQWKNEEEH